VREDLIVFGEGVGIAKIFLEEIHRFDCNFLDVRRQVLHLRVERLYRVQTHGNVIGLTLRRNIYLQFLIRPYDKTVQITGQQLRRPKLSYLVVRRNAVPVTVDHRSIVFLIGIYYVFSHF
jgi:hypothetical protein